MMSIDATRSSTADFLCLAATPIFAFMALMTGMSDGVSPEMICAAVPQAFPFNGMVTMYVLMSAFHSAPWLKLIANFRSTPSLCEE